MTITLERPQQVAILQDIEAFVTLADASGNRMDGATVYLAQDMPSMKMSSNQPLGEPLGNGQYRLKSVFTMDGYLDGGGSRQHRREGLRCIVRAAGRATAVSAKCKVESF